MNIMCSVGSLLAVVTVFYSGYRYGNTTSTTSTSPNVDINPSI